MKIGIVAGGTLGHIMPGIVLSKELSKKHDVIFITSKKDKRFDILNNCSCIKKIYFVDVVGLNKKIYKNISPVIKAIKGRIDISKIIKEEKINLLIGMGGYVSGVAMLTKTKNVKKIIHEQNKVMGLANKIALNKVDKILLTFKMDLKDQYKRKSYVVSNPCLFTNIPSNKKGSMNILITSGSNGAKEINDLAIELIKSNHLNNYHITLVTGKKYYEEVISQVKPKHNIIILPFVDNMSEYIYNASLIISRAGSSTIFESLALDTVPLLFPSHNVTNNHQYYNALEVVNNGMGEIIDKDNVLKKISKVRNNYMEYLSNIRRYKKHYSLENIINIIEEE